MAFIFSGEEAANFLEEGKTIRKKRKSRIVLSFLENLKFDKKKRVVCYH